MDRFEVRAGRRSSSWLGLAMRLTSGLTTGLWLCAVSPASALTINSGVLSWNGSTTLADDLQNLGTVNALAAVSGGAGQFFTISGSLDNDGEFNLHTNDPAGGFPARGTLSVSNGVDNSGAIHLQTSGNFGNSQSWVTLNVGSGTSTGVLTNSGSILADPHGFFLDQGPAAGTGGPGFRRIAAELHNLGSGVLRNDYGLALVVSGLAGDLVGPDHVNAGVVHSAGGGITFEGFSSFTNTGGLLIDAGRTLTFTSGGAAGVVENALGGVISGHGTLSLLGGSFLNSGVISPGTSFGDLTISGSILQGATGVLDLEIGGDALGFHDRLILPSGTLTLDGTLRLRFVDGFAPTSGQTIDLILGGVVGSFDTVEVLGLAPGFQFDLDPSAGALTLVANSNGVSTVPEPATVLLVGAGLAGLALQSRRPRLRPGAR